MEITTNAAVAHNMESKVTISLEAPSHEEAAPAASKESIPAIDSVGGELRQTMSRHRMRRKNITLSPVQALQFHLNHSK